MTQLSGNWSFPTRVWFGAGRIDDLPAACAETGMKAPLLVVDPGLSGTAMATDILKRLRGTGLQVGLFDRLQGNPTSVNLADGIAAYRAGNHDGVVAIGGGSALDVGKTVALMVGQTRPVWDFEDIGDWWKRASTEGIAPVIAVPTTSGTGSEVGRATVITNVETHAKKIIFHPMMMPRIAICDPALTLGLPPLLTAGTGMDALSHAFEAYCAPGFHPMADAIALEGMRLVQQSLARAVKNGSDLEARANMMAAAGMGATAFQKGLGLIHSVSHPIGALYNTHHGLTNAVVMPYVIAFNAEAIGEKMQHLAHYLRLDGAGATAAGAVNAVRDWVLRLRSEIGIPATIAELGVDTTRFEEIARLAVIDPTAGTNPIPFTEPDVVALLRDMHDGTLRPID